jgi:CRP-like cAMP-binding protein
MDDDNVNFSNPAIFGRLQDTSKDLILDLAVEQQVSSGETVFLQGDPGDAVYYVLNGMIEISVLSPAGRKLTLNVVKPGELFGEIAVLDYGTRTSSAIAAQKSNLARIDRKSLLHLMRQKPEICFELIAILCGRLRWISRQVEDQAFLPLQLRLAKGLLMLQRRLQNKTDALVLSQSEIADFVGATREATNKTLNLWQAEGLLEMGRGQIKILDPEALRDIAEISL